jgi:ABC-type multidrug transport system fused ATPase/permease subunit
LQKFLDTPNKIKNWRKKYVYEKWKIEIKNLDFAYNKDKQIFKNLNLEFLANKKNALIGHSWWWKSTIIKLILRLYDYEKWEILIDNQELKSLKIESFYKEIWYLSQEPWVFDGTIRENLEYAFDDNILGNENREKLIWEALKKAQIDEMVKNFKKWLDTEIWEKWVKLSWWEKQRLAIARIFLKNPKIVILDEPTSALDSISEYKITKALDELTKWRTSIIIAHRLQTVMQSDKIIVLENWKIEAEWKHKDLLKKSKIYKTLVDLQNGVILE